MTSYCQPSLFYDTRLVRDSGSCSFFWGGIWKFGGGTFPPEMPRINTVWPWQRNQKKKKWQTGYSPRPPTSPYRSKSLHAGWSPVCSSIFQCLLKSVQWFWSCGWSKIALPYYFGQWLIQQLVLPYKTWYCVSEVTYAGFPILHNVHNAARTASEISDVAAVQIESNSIRQVFSVHPRSNFIFHTFWPWKQKITWWKYTNNHGSGS